MHLERCDVLDGPQAHRITGSQHMGLRLLQERAGDEHDRTANIGSSGAISTEVKGESDTGGVCTVMKWACYVYMLNLYVWV